MADPRHALGLQAERTVEAWLSRRGWTVLGRRVRSATGGEVDLVAVDPKGFLVGIEVRCRRGRRTGEAAETIDRRRVGRIGRTLAAYAAERSTMGRAGLRVDLVTVEPDPHRPRHWRLRRVPVVP